MQYKHQKQEKEEDDDIEKKEEEEEEGEELRGRPFFAFSAVIVVPWSNSGMKSPLQTYRSNSKYPGPLQPHSPFHRIIQM